MMKSVREYIKYRRYGIFLFLLCGFIIFFILYLAKASLYYLIYAYLLCLFFGGIVVFRDFHKFYRKKIALQDLTKTITLGTQELPTADNQIEQQYQELLQILYKEQTSLTSLLDQRYTEIMNYYTIWAHQIKTPIAAMHILLQSEEFSNKAVIENELFKVEQYVEMVLSYLRLGSDTTDYQIQHYDLDSIVKQAIRKYARLFIQKKLTLTYEPIKANVLTDEKWLLFVIEQVLSNSLKYTSTGGITIFLEEPCILVIQDTGIGIAAEDIARVFEKGFTGYNGRSDKKSTGLGLYLCNMIMERLGHKISLESEPGKGTKVRLMLESLKMTHE